jgi:hypothetical protein
MVCLSLAEIQGFFGGFLMNLANLRGSARARKVANTRRVL